MAALRTPDNRFMDVNGLRLHYLDWGGSSDKSLVLLHGISGNGHVWDEFAQQAAQEYHVYALDQRGHGDSEHAREGYRVTAFASDIFEFTRLLGIAPFDLVGASLGGRNAMPFAAQHSRLMKHLVLVDIGPEMSDDSARGVKGRITQRPLGFRDMDHALEYFTAAYPTRPRAQLEHQATHALRRNWAGKLVWKHDPELSWITGSAGLKEIPLLWDSCARITCPTLIMRGETSDILSPEIVDKMLAIMPAAKAIEIPNAGHAIYYDQPAAFAEAVLDFLRTPATQNM